MWTCDLRAENRDEKNKNYPLERDGWQGEALSGMGDWLLMQGGKGLKGTAIKEARSLHQNQVWRLNSIPTTVRELRIKST